MSARRKITGLELLLKEKGVLSKTRRLKMSKPRGGRPGMSDFVTWVIYAKIKQIMKGEKARGHKITMLQAWKQLTQHRNFKLLMKEHYKNNSWPSYNPNPRSYDEQIKQKEWIKNFYKNNLVRSRLKQRLSKIEFTY